MKRFLSLILVVAFATGAFAQSQVKDVLPYDALMRSARVYLSNANNRDYEKASEMLEIAIANYPDPVEAYFWKGLIHAEKAEYAEMMSAFRMFEAICDSAKAQKNDKLLKRCEKDGMPKKINDQKQSELSKNLASGLRNLKLADSLREATVDSLPESVKTKNEEAIKALLTKSKGLFNDGAIISDTTAGIWTNLAVIEERLGNHEEALRLYEKSYALNPKDAAMVYDLANVAFTLKDFPRAARYYGEFGELDKANAEVAFMNQAMSYQMAKDDAGLEKALHRILEVNPLNAEIRYQRGMIYIRNASAREILDSISRLDELLEKSPGNAAAKKSKDELLAQRQKFNELAYDDFKVAAENQSTDDFYWYWYGTSAFFLQRDADALKAYEKCVEVKPDNSDCWCQLAILYLRKGQKAQAEAAQAKCNK